MDNKSAEKRARSNGGEQEAEEGGAGLGGGARTAAIYRADKPTINYRSLL